MRIQLENIISSFIYLVILDKKLNKFIWFCWIHQTGFWASLHIPFVWWIKLEFITEEVLRIVKKSNKLIKVLRNIRKPNEIDHCILVLHNHHHLFSLIYGICSENPYIHVAYDTNLFAMIGQFQLNRQVINEQHERI